MPEFTDINNEINKKITETYASKGQDYLFPAEGEQERRIWQNPLNKQLERPIDWEVLKKIQFHSQLSCLAGNDLADGLFRLKEPYRSQMEAEYAEEMRRVEVEFANEFHHQSMQERRGDVDGDHEDREFDGASYGDGGTSV